MLSWKRTCKSNNVLCTHQVAYFLLSIPRSFVQPFIYPSIHLPFLCPSVHPFIHLSILSFYLFFQSVHPYVRAHPGKKETTDGLDLHVIFLDQCTFQSNKITLSLHLSIDSFPCLPSEQGYHSLSDVSFQ